ncbi:MAG: thiamine pyrophosphate-dependent enzyme [Candidatus Pacearchaeota archaeon]|jgi:pyruvate dehydrogenase E1 component alpha subunit
MNKQQLIDFEKRIADLWEDAKIKYPVHLSGGNEEQLIKIFKEIKQGDYVFSTHRNHYHYLLAGGNEKDLERKIISGHSMHIFDKEKNFLSSAIVAGTPAIAAGVALALKYKQSKNKVWCFVGDGAEDEGHFYEAVRYVDGFSLPCTFIIEDNDRSVETTKKERYGSSEMKWPNCVLRYEYNATYPHVGTGKIVDFSKDKKIKSDGGVGGNSF